MQLSAIMTSCRLLIKAVGIWSISFILKQTYLSDIVIIIVHLWFFSEGFIVLAIESFWTRLFSQYFVCNDDETRDDLLFYVKGKSTNKDGKVAKETEVQPISSVVVLYLYTCTVKSRLYIYHGFFPGSLINKKWYRWWKICGFSKSKGDIVSAVCKYNFLYETNIVGLSLEY